MELHKTRCLPTFTEAKRSVSASSLYASLYSFLNAFDELHRSGDGAKNASLGTQESNELGDLRFLSQSQLTTDLTCILMMSSDAW